MLRAGTLRRLWQRFIGTAPSPEAVEVLVYTRSGCHLCDEACELLVRYGLAVKTQDIDADPALRERYTSCVPVVFINGKERFRGRVNEVLLRRLLRRLTGTAEMPSAGRQG